MSVRARTDRAPQYLCDVQGCSAHRASSTGAPRGWVEGERRFHLCTLHRHLLERYNQIVRTSREGLWALTGYKGAA